MLLLPLLLVLLAAAGGTSAQHHHKPKPSDLARTARWLMHEATWGVLSTLSTTTGAPFGTWVARTQQQTTYVARWLNRFPSIAYTTPHR